MSKKDRQGMSKRQEFREKRRRSQQRSRAVVIGIIAVVAVVFVFLIVYPQIRPVAQVIQVTPLPRGQVNRNMQGNPKALVTLTEFSDFQCPYCKQFWTTTQAQVETSYVQTGKVYFVYRSAGNWVSRNSPGDTESQDAAMAAYCAADQNKFWEMHDALFGNNRDLEDQGSFTPRRLQAIAQSVGLDMGAYNSCFSSSKYLNQVNQDGQDFQQAAPVDQLGTPFFLITYTVNGQTKTDVIEGAQPFSSFQPKLDAALAAAGAK